MTNAGNANQPSQRKKEDENNMREIKSEIMDDKKKKTKYDEKKKGRKNISRKKKEKIPCEKKG